MTPVLAATVRFSARHCPGAARRDSLRAALRAVALACLLAGGGALAADPLIVIPGPAIPSTLIWDNDVPRARIPVAPLPPLPQTEAVTAKTASLLVSLSYESPSSTAHVVSSRDAREDNRVQRVQVLDGQWAQIRTRQPASPNARIDDATDANVNEMTLRVLPKLSDGTVVLQVIADARRGGRMSQTDSVSTTLRAPLGRWVYIVMNGAEPQSTTQTRASSRDARAQSTQISIKVDLLR